MERKSVAAGLQRVLPGGCDPEDRCAEDRAFDLPAAEDDDRKRDEAAPGGHVLGKAAGKYEREVRATESGEDRLNAEGGPAMQRDGVSSGRHRLGILTAGAQTQSESRPPQQHR